MIKRIIIIFILIYCFLIPKVYGTQEIVSSQMESLNIQSLIKEGQAYTNETFPEIKIDELLNSAIQGKIENKGIIKGILSAFGTEITSSFKLIGSILFVIVINSILKAFSDNLDDKGVSQIAYYVEYILLITIIMANFTNIISLIKDTITNLVGFASSLIPILLALIAASRKCCYNVTFGTYNSFLNCFYCKHNYSFYITINIYINSNINCF